MFADGDGLESSVREPGETPAEKAPIALRTKFPETWIWDNKTTGLYISSFDFKANIFLTSYLFRNMYRKATSTPLRGVASHLRRRQDQS